MWGGMWSPEQREDEDRQVERRGPGSGCGDVGLDVGWAGTCEQKFLKG